MGLGANIKKIRLLKKVSVAELAEKIDVNVQSIYDWEKGKYEPVKENLESIAGALGVPLKVFFEENNTDMPKADDNNEKQEMEAAWDMIEKSEKYTVVPTIILDKYEILSNREIESRETTLQEVRATMKIAIEAKDQVIAIQQEEIEELREKLKALTPSQNAH